MKKLAQIVSASLALLAPAFAFAQSSGTQINSVQDVAKFAIDFINNIAVPLVFAVAFLVFIYGVFTYFIAGAASDEKRETGRQFMLYGIIGFFVMISVWGLVRILTGTAQLNNSQLTPGSNNGLPKAQQTGA